MIYTICNEHGSHEAIMVENKPICPECIAEYGHNALKHRVFRIKKAQERKVIPFPIKKKD